MLGCLDDWMNEWINCSNPWPFL